MKNKKAVNLIINLAITLVFGFIYFYFRLPAINLHDPAFYGFFFLLSLVFCLLTAIGAGILKAQTGEEVRGLIKSRCAVPLIVCLAFLLLIIVGHAVGWPIFRAKAYSSLLELETGDFVQDVDEIGFGQIPMLDEDSAKKLGDRKMGELAEYVSQFEVADNYTQINYNGRPVRVTPLVYGDLIKWFTNRSDGLPAYLIIDMVDQDVEVVRLEEGMKYTTAEHFGRYLYRHLRFSYPTFMFDEATFEINEEGTPYWVCPRIVKRIGLFGGTDIKGAVLVNAITGESEYYEDVPNWVDRVYTANIIIQQYDYHGMYQSGWFNSMFGQKNVTRTTEGYNYIAVGDDVYMYTGITSVMSDESNIGFILTNQRTKETKFYPIAGAEEFSAMDSAEGVVQQYKYKATFPLLLNIGGQPTYFMSMKDEAQLVKMYAMVNVQQYQMVATGATMAECERNYIDLMAGSGITSAAPGTEVRGEIEVLRYAVVEGSTRAYIRLTGGKVFYTVSVADDEIAAVLSVGDQIKFWVNSQEGDFISAYNLTLEAK